LLENLFNMEKANDVRAARRSVVEECCPSAIGTTSLLIVIVLVGRRAVEYHVADIP